MQLLVDIEEVSAAPVAVRDWFYSRLGTAVPQSKKEETPKVEAVSVEPPVSSKVVERVSKSNPVEVKQPSVDELLELAVELIEKKGEDALKAVLDKVGVKRVKECPVDKRAELLAEIAVHA